MKKAFSHGGVRRRKIFSSGAPALPGITDAAAEIAYLADEAISMAVEAEQERCIRIVRVYCSGTAVQIEQLITEIRGLKP